MRFLATFWLRRWSLSAFLRVSCACRRQNSGSFSLSAENRAHSTQQHPLLGCCPPQTSPTRDQRCRAELGEEEDEQSLHPAALSGCCHKRAAGWVEPARASVSPPRPLPRGQPSEDGKKCPLPAQSPM